MDYSCFIKIYCRRVPGSKGGECLSLKEKSNLDCIFWNDGCTVYQARPQQCRTFPFWKSLVKSSSSWKDAGTCCPGINTGKLHDRETIEACLAAGPPIITGKEGGFKDAC
jgi:Fe-S-cluster containining protein